jgi:hypothetical protein
VEERFAPASETPEQSDIANIDGRLPITRLKSSTANEAVVPRRTFGLTGIVVKPPERVPVLSPVGAVTESAWRLEITSDQGTGDIVLLDTRPRRSSFQGDGVFLGWSQAQLTEAYRTFTEPLRARGTDLELLQLG